MYFYPNLPRKQTETSFRHIAFDDLWSVWFCLIFRNYFVNSMIL